MKIEPFYEGEQKAVFEIGELVFTVTSDFWLHVADKSMRQENAFGQKATVALMTAVKDGHFTDPENEPSIQWFSSREGFYVEHYRTWKGVEKPHVIIHAGNGYRLHLDIVEFELLVAKLTEILELRPLPAIEVACD